MTIRILVGDARKRLREIESGSVHCCVTSPPYFGLRDYGTATWEAGDPNCDHLAPMEGGRSANKGAVQQHAARFAGAVCRHCGARRIDDQIGLELTPSAYISELTSLFREVRRVLRDDGTCWINIGDSYAGSWNAQGHRKTESDDPSWHSSQIKNHPKAARQTGTIRESGLKPKDLIGMPWMLAFALRDDGWYLRKDIIWAKKNPMPESVSDRPTSSHEYVFLLSKSKRYFYDAEAVKEPIVVEGWDDGSRILGGINKHGANLSHGDRTTGRVAVKGNAKTFRGGVYVNGRSFDNGTSQERDSHGNSPNETGTRNLRDVWHIASEPFPEAHFATFPTRLVEPCIKAGCPAGGTVLDPFGGAGTTGLVADRLRRSAILIDLNPGYVEMAAARIRKDAKIFANVSVEAAP